MTRARCSAKRLLSGLQRLDDGKKQAITEYGFGGLFQVGCEKLNMSLCLWIISKVNVAYQHIEMEGGVSIPLTCTQVGHVFGIPHTGRTIQLDLARNRGAKVPSIYDIENRMVECNMEEFKRLFIIFSCATFLAPTARLEGAHALWHAPTTSLSGELNWGQFVLHELMRGIHDFRTTGGSYVRGCLMFLQLWYVSYSHFPPMAMPTSIPRAAHWNDSLINKRIKMEVQMLGQLGRVQFNQQLQQNDHGNDNPPSNEQVDMSTSAQTLEAIVARMEGRKTQIEGAQWHLNSLIDSYVRDMETMKSLVASSLASQSNNAQQNPPPPPAAPSESSDGNDGRDDIHGFEAPGAEEGDRFPSANMPTNVGGATEAPDVGLHSNEDNDNEIPDHDSPPSPERVEPEVPHEASVHPMAEEGSDHDSDTHINTHQDAVEANMEVDTDKGNDNAPRPSTVLSESHSQSPTMDRISNPMSPMCATENIDGTQIVPENNMTLENADTLPNPSNPTRKRRTKATAGRLRKKGPTCKSPFVNYCLTKYSRLNQQETSIADYAFDESRDAMEVLCSYGGYGITRGQMQCLAGQGPVDTVLVTIICRYLNVLEGAGGKRHFMLPSFGDIACGMAMNASKKAIRTKLGKFSKGIDGCDQLFIPICQFNQWVVFGVNLEGSRIHILSSAPTLHSTHFIAEGRKIAKFLHVLLMKAFRRNHIEWKALEPIIVDLPTHNRTEDNGLYAVLYMLNWDGSGLSRALTAERIGLERLKIAVMLMEAKENELKSTVFCNIFPGQTDMNSGEVAEEDMN